MSFKIVQTFENGELTLVVVPTAWESAGALYWPNTKNLCSIERNLRDANSKPCANWTATSCIMKRSGFMSFTDAELELKAMKEGGKCTTVTAVATAAVADVLDAKLKQKAKELHQRPIDAEQNALTNLALQSAELLNMLNTINERLNVIQKNQHKIMRKLTKQSVEQKVIIRRLNCNQRYVNADVDALIKMAADKQNDADGTSSVLLKYPISSQHELEEFEAQLNDKAQMGQLIMAMKSKCGETGTADATHCCYHLVDFFFSREFLLNVSWSGASRTDSQKIALKNYKNVLNVFNTLVRFAASDFDEKKSKDFFLTIFRNGKKRLRNEPEVVARKRRSASKRPSEVVEDAATSSAEAESSSDVNTTDEAMHIKLEADEVNGTDTLTFPVHSDDEVDVTNCIIKTEKLFMEDDSISDQSEYLLYNVTQLSNEAVV